MHLVEEADSCDTLFPPRCRPSQVLIEPAPAALEARLARRAAAGRHFMPPSLLASQLSTLRYDPAELYLHFADEAALQPPADIVSLVLRRLREGQSGQQGRKVLGSGSSPTDEAAPLLPFSGHASRPVTTLSGTLNAQPN